MNVGEMALLAGQLGSHIHGARMVSLMTFVTIFVKMSLFCLCLPPMRL